MRIALLAPFGMQPKGTVQARILPLAHALAERGHLVRVVVPPWDDPDARRGGGRSEGIEVASSGDGGETGGVHTVTLPLPKRVPNSIALTWGLVREGIHPTIGKAWATDSERDLASFRAEVVHVFKPVGYTGLAGFALAGLQVPWVLDVDDWEGRGGWADVNHYSGVERLSIRLMESMLPRMAGGVTAASRTLEARAWNMGIPRRRVIYLPNGVWRDKYGSWTGAEQPGKLKAELGLDGRPVVLLYTRFDVFPVGWVVEIMQKVLVEHPTAKLLVVGRGFGGEEVELQEMAARAGIEDRIVMAGYVSGDRLPGYLSLGDVCVYPMKDTLLNRAKSPVKVLEPMVLGLPIVAHRVGEVVQFVGDAGVLVAPGDIEGMGRVVSELLGDEARRVRLGDMAINRVWGEFGWEGLSERAEEAYRIATGG